MCESNLIVDACFNVIEIPLYKHSFIYHDKGGNKHTLLSDFDMGGVINFAAVHKITDSHGVKSGYMFVIGDKDD